MISFNWLFVFSQYRLNDFNNTMKAKDYNVLNLKLQYKKNNFTGYICVNNLLNKKHSTFQASNGYTVASGENPAPERNVVVGVKHKF